MENDPVKNDDTQNLELIVKAFEYTVDPVALLYDGKRIIFCNRAWKTYHALDPDTDITGQDFNSMITDEGRRLIIECREVLDNGKVYEK